MKIYYVVRDKETGLHWHGGTTFNKRVGYKYMSFEQAARALANKDWKGVSSFERIKTAGHEIEIAQQLVAPVTGVVMSMEDALRRGNLLDALRRVYGTDFEKLYLKEIDVEGKPYCYAAKVPYHRFDEFMENIRNLGCNMRSFKKNQQWLLFKDADNALRARLAGDFDHFFALETLEEDVTKL